MPKHDLLYVLVSGIILMIESNMSPNTLGLKNVSPSIIVAYLRYPNIFQPNIL